MRRCWRCDRRLGSGGQTSGWSDERLTNVRLVTQHSELVILGDAERVDVTVHEVDKRVILMKINEFPNHTHTSSNPPTRSYPIRSNRLILTYTSNSFHQPQGTRQTQSTRMDRVYSFAAFSEHFAGHESPIAYRARTASRL